LIFKSEFLLFRVKLCKFISINWSYYYFVTLNIATHWCAGLLPDCIPVSSITRATVHTLKPKI